MTFPDSLSNLRQRLSHQKLLPGITVISLVILARVLGLFQALELRTLDTFLRWRPAESTDERILVVGINEADIQQMGTYPMPDREMAQLLETLLANEPRVIGIDIYRDLPVEPGHQALRDLLASQPNIIGVEKVIAGTVPPPAALAPEQVGFVDFPLDPDGFVRRAYLGSLPSLETPDPDRFRFSFGLRLAETYLAAEKIPLENGIRNPDNFRFGDAELFQLVSASGSYVDMEAAGLQLLINPRSGIKPFETVSMADVMNGNVDAELIRDRIVIIGITSLSVKDLVNSAAVNSSNPGLVYGVQMHTHFTSQLLSTVLDGRPMLRVWGEGWEYLWIILWGGTGIVLGRMVRRPEGYSLAVGVASLGLTGLSFALLWLVGLWIPVVPALVLLMVNGLILPSIYLYDHTLRSRIHERQQIIERTYDAIHNGPLQTLATLLQQKEDLQPAISNKLENLDNEIRSIYVGLLQESLPEEHQLQLGTQRIIDLRHPLKEILYEIYNATLERDFPGFESLNVCLPDFQPLLIKGLSSNNKRSICRFLEEALCNVGKHATNPKRLEVSCIIEGDDNVIRIQDNAQNQAMTEHKRQGRGTQQANVLAKRLRGSFSRDITPKGTLCELRWPVSHKSR